MQEVQFGFLQSALQELQVADKLQSPSTAGGNSPHEALATDTDESEIIETAMRIAPAPQTSEISLRIVNHLLKNKSAIPVT
jgi:hypothetical protein